MERKVYVDILYNMLYSADILMYEHHFEPIEI